VLIPVEDEEDWATQYYRSYNVTYGLVCKGDGEKAIRMIDVQTKELPVANKAGTVTMVEMECPGRDCPEYKSKKCHEVMNLKFLIPEVPGLGVWQIDTGSKNSILNINSCARIIKRAFGRISLIPLKLTFEPTRVNNPEDGKKQIVYVLNLRTDVTLAQLADQAKEQAKMFMLEAPDLEAMAEMQIEKDIDDLWGEKKVVTTTGEVVEPEEEPQPEETDALKSKSRALKPESNSKPPAEPEVEQQAEAEASPEQPEPEPVNIAWLTESLETLKVNRQGWGDENILNFLEKSYKVESDDVMQAVGQLNEAQMKHFVGKVSEALEKMEAGK